MLKNDESPVSFRDVCVSLNENVIFKNISFNLSKGEFLYLVGKVGSGKSTLMKSMYGEQPIESGSAHVLDYALHNLRRKHIPLLRRKIGIVFQDFQLLTDRTVGDNLEFVLRSTGWKVRKEIEKRIEEVMQQVEMPNKAYKMPHELSGGEQQRIVIARALLNNPILILADEPTGNLDPETSDQIVTLLHRISKEGTSVMMSTHNYALVKKFPARMLKCEGASVYDIDLSSVE